MVPMDGGVSELMTYDRISQLPQPHKHGCGATTIAFKLVVVLYYFVVINLGFGSDLE